MSSEKFGIVSSPSSSSQIKVLALESSQQVPVVGRMVQFDIEMSDGLYRGIGTVGNISTENNAFSDPALTGAIVRNLGGNASGVDRRSTNVVIQSVYRQNSSGGWDQYGSAMPTSPSTKTPVTLIEEEDVHNLIPDGGQVVYLGRFRGLDAAAPMTLPNFSSKRGAVHSVIAGRSGSGKTGGATFILSAQMKHENHAIIVVDPQGQWNNENGFIFSVKRFAAGLGREVSALRVSEDIRLSMDEELLAQLMSHVNLWSNFRRMGKDNQEALSREVATIIAERVNYGGHFDELENPESLLTKVFARISQSQSSLDRVYARGDTQGALQRDLAVMSGSEPKFPMDKEGVVDLITAEEDAEGRQRLSKILEKFSPIINLFAAHNFAGGKRRALRGQNGFLTQVLQSRPETPDTPAPYVVLDMSSDVTNATRGAYASGIAKKTQEASEDLTQTRILSRMRELLDNADIKALIITSILTELKEASEEAFAVGGGNLNTQVVFDEAWRYAPPINNIGRDTPIGALSAMLEGFALDTRKYGIGWTYILQSPSDLNRGIWRQASFVYSAYGIQGGDKRMLEELMDDTSQMALYNQFASPASTGLYPFMINGPVSPLIFTNTPSFINIFNNLEDFLSANSRWMDEITQRRQLPYLSKSAEQLSMLSKSSGFSSPAKSAAVSSEPAKSYAIGGTRARHTPSATPTSKSVSVADSIPSTSKVAPPPF